LLTRVPTNRGSGGKGRKIGDKPDRLPLRRRLRGHSGTRVVQRPSEPVEPLQRVHVPRLKAAPKATGSGRDTAARDPLVAIPGYVPREVP
jgi:hypothetical protein